MKDLHPIPTAPKALPVIGHLVQVLRDPLVFLKSLPAHGKLVRIWVGPFAIIAVCDPELTQQALLHDRVFDKGGPIYDRIREIMGSKGLASCPHTTHRRLRRLTQPAFQPARLAGYAEAMTACIEDEIRSWRAGQIMDVHTAMTAITFKITTTTLFSGALPTAEMGTLLDDVTAVFDGIAQRMLLIPPLDRLPTRGNRSYLRARTNLRNTLGQMIDQRRADGTDHGDLLSALVAAQDPEDGGRCLSDTEIRDTVVTFFLGATETTAATLAWALDLLARHPQVEQRLHAEVDAALGGAPATHADLPRLELTQRIVTETLRLRSPAWFLTRKVTADTSLGEYQLPTGTSVVYSPYLIHHRPDLFEDPESFDPDRWDPQRPQPPRHAMLPFATGARKCIGDSFAMTAATLTLATIATRWRLEHLPGAHETRPVLALALRPHKLLMLVKPGSPRTVRHPSSSTGTG